MFYYKYIAAGMLDFEHSVENIEHIPCASFGYRQESKARYNIGVTR